MFTGIVEEKAKVVHLKKSKDIYVLDITARRISKGLRIGESVAVNGVCLTVTKIQSPRIFFDIMRESLLATSLGQLKSGDWVNCERAISNHSRFNGHFVTGHVDAAVPIKKITREGKFVEFQIVLPRAIKRYIVTKGSISVDGVSLTIGRVGTNWFSVFLIPLTLKITTLGQRCAGDLVNLEADLLAKYILKSG